MNTKINQLNEAEILFTQKMYTLKEISKELAISTKTLSKWKKDCDWEEKRNKFFENKTTLENDILNLTQKVVELLQKEVNSGSINPLKIIAANNLIKSIDSTRKYKKEKKQDEKTTTGQITKDTIKRIKTDILGIKDE